MWACGAMGSELPAACVTGGDMAEPGTTTSVQRRAVRALSLQAVQMLANFGVGAVAHKVHQLTCTTRSILVLVGEARRK